MTEKTENCITVKEKTFCLVPSSPGKTVKSDFADMFGLFSLMILWGIGFCWVWNNAENGWYVVAYLLVTILILFLIAA